MAIALKSQQITNLVERLRFLFPKQMQALQDAKARFEATYAAYEEAVQAGDGQKAESLRVALQQSQAAMEQPACTLGLAIAAFLSTEQALDPSAVVSAPPGDALLPLSGRPDQAVQGGV